MRELTDLTVALGGYLETVALLPAAALALALFVAAAHRARRRRPSDSPRPEIPMSDPIQIPDVPAVTPEMSEADERNFQRMADGTSLLPHVVADSVVRELAVQLHRTGASPWLVNLLDQEANDLAMIVAKRAAAIYCANAARDADFARDLRKASGRDTLYAFTRHWLAGLLRERHGQRAVDALPDGFTVGRAPAIGR